MHLKTQFPNRVFQAILQGDPGIQLPLGAIHRLKKKVAVVEMEECLGIHAVLGIDKFQFISTRHSQVRIRLRADAHPVNARRQGQCSIRLDCDLDAARMERLYERGVKLQQRLPSRADNKRRRPSGTPGPTREYGFDDLIRGSI